MTVYSHSGKWNELPRWCGSDYAIGCVIKRNAIGTRNKKILYSRMGTVNLFTTENHVVLYTSTHKTINERVTNNVILPEAEAINSSFLL